MTTATKQLRHVWKWRDAGESHFTHARNRPEAATVFRVSPDAVTHAVTCWCQIDTPGGRLGVARREAKD